MFPVVRPFKEIVDDRLRSTGQSATGLARRAGLNREAIRSVLRGRVPSVDRAARICDALGLEFYIGPPRHEGAKLPLPPNTDAHGWDDRRGKEVMPHPVAMHEGHSPERVGFSPHGCAYFGLEFLLNFDLDPDLCEVVQIFDDSMAPEFPPGSAGLVDLRRTERVDGRVCALAVPHLTVRRVRELPSGWALVADNPRIETIRWQDDFRIVGKIVWTSHMVETAPVG